MKRKNKFLLGGSFFVFFSFVNFVPVFAVSPTGKIIPVLSSSAVKQEDSSREKKESIAIGTSPMMVEKNLQQPPVNKESASVDIDDPLLKHLEMQIKKIADHSKELSEETRLFTKEIEKLVIQARQESKINKFFQQFSNWGQKHLSNKVAHDKNDSEEKSSLKKSATELQKEELKNSKDAMPSVNFGQQVLQLLQGKKTQNVEHNKS